MVRIEELLDGSSRGRLASFFLWINIVQAFFHNNNNNNNNENFIEFFYALTIENLTVKGNLQLAT